MSRRCYHSLSFLVLCGLGLVLPYVSCDVVVKTASGKVRGRNTGSSLQFLGIPYGTPPVGDLRWRAPVKASPWSPSTFNASQFGPACPQQGCFKHLPARSCTNHTSEDCLYVNVWTPVKAGPSTAYPVMVFIHGGGFKWGSIQAHSYDGNNLVKFGNVVLVTLQYRLGLLGFMYTGDGADDSHGNLGIQDQRLALLWVRNNIANFGGDPEKVTLFGQSAGAQSVTVHMADPRSQGIIESSPFSLPYRNKEKATRLANDVAKILTCREGDMQCLRSKTVDKILDAEDEVIIRITSAELVDYFEDAGPVIDGVEIIDQPLVAAASGKIRDIPTMVGTTSEEGVLFVYGGLKKNLTKTEYEAAIAVVHPTHVEEMEKQYKEPEGPDFRDALSQFITDYLFTCANRNFSRNLLSHRNANVFRYVFDHASQGRGGWGIDTFCEGRVCHAAN